MLKQKKIKQYLEGRNQEKPVNLDLSKIVDINHSKVFATKEEVTNELKRITYEHNKTLDELRKEEGFSKKEIFERINKVNEKFSSQIVELLRKIDSERLAISENILGELENKSVELSDKIEATNEPIYKIIDSQKNKIIELQELLGSFSMRISKISIPKEVKVKAGKNVKVDTKETDKTIEYTISSKAEQNIHMLHNMGVQQIIPGANITVSPTDGKGTVTISSTALGVSSAGSTFYAGTGIEISGSTITNTLPGVSLQAGNNILIQGVTISATNAGVSLTDNLPEGVSNFYYRPDRFVGIGGASVSYSGLTLTVYAQSTGSPAWGDITGSLSSQTDLYEELVTKLSGTSTTDLLNEGVSNFYYKPSNFTGTGGVSVSVSGKTVTIYGLSTALNTNQITEGTSNFYYTEARFTSSLGTKTTNNLSEGSSALYYSQQRFDSAFAGKNTDNLTEGVSNFYYKPAYLIGTGGVSISISGKTITVYGLSTALDQTTLGLSSFGEKSYNSLTEQPDLTVYAKGTSLFGLYILGTSFHNAVTVADSTTIDLGISSNQAITASVIQTGLGLSALGEKSYNSLNNKLGFVGTGGVSVSLSGSTYTIYGLSTAINSNQVSEGTSNFYYRVDRLASDTGISVYKNGVTAKIGVVQADINTNNITEGNSGLFYSMARFNSSFATKNTNDLTEGTSNFYYNPVSFVGTGGASVSVSGRTLTVYASSGTASPAGASGEIQFNNGGIFGSTNLFTYSSENNTLYVSNVYPSDNTSNLYLETFELNDTGTPGDIYLRAGTNNLDGVGGNIYITAGTASGEGEYSGGNLELRSGFADSTLGLGGDIILYPAYGSSTNVDGRVKITSTQSTNKAVFETESLTEDRIFNFPDSAGTFVLAEAIVGTGGASISVTGSTITIYGLSRGVQISKSVYIEGVTNTDLIPFLRIENNSLLEKTVYDISGGTQWVGQVQRWNNAQGASKYSTQSADSGVTTNTVVTSYAGATVLSGEYLAIKGSSIYGGISWLLVNIYYREY